MQLRGYLSMLSLLFIVLAVLCCVGWAANIPSPLDYHVTGLDKFGANDKMYAGLMPLAFESNTEGAIFFWLAKQRNRNPNEKRKLVIWLNGGPGCSSMVGMMWENGPFNIEFGENGQKYQLKHNNYSWNTVADVLFVEQPIRVGYSPAHEHAPIIRNEGQIANDFRSFLLSFMTVFTEYKGVELFVSGESYAGFYIPWIAAHVVLSQMVPGSDGVYVRDTSVDGINLVGAAIGNGVLDYLHQEPSYAEYAFTHGLIPRQAKDYFDMLWTRCLDDLQASNRPLTRGSFNKCNLMGKVLVAAGSPNEYDTSTFVNYDRITQPGGAFDMFFQDEEIQKALHVRGWDIPGLNFVPEGMANVSVPAGEEGQEGIFYYPPQGWHVCNDHINAQMSRDHPTSAVPVLQFLADFSTHHPGQVYDPASVTDKQMRGSMRVLLYSGEFDLNCNTLGTMHTLEANYWRKRAWKTADRSLWKFNNDVAGEYFTMESIFSFLIVRNSGHLLPMDLPATALEMLDRFIHDRSFADHPLPSEASYVMPDMLQTTLTGRVEEGVEGVRGGEGGGFVAVSVAILFFVMLIVMYKHKYRSMEMKLRVFEEETQSESFDERSSLLQQPQYYQGGNC